MLAGNNNWKGYLFWTLSWEYSVLKKLWKCWTEWKRFITKCLFKSHSITIATDLWLVKHFFFFYSFSFSKTSSRHLTGTCQREGTGEAPAAEKRLWTDHGWYTGGGETLLSASLEHSAVSHLIGKHVRNSEKYRVSTVQKKIHCQQPRYRKKSVSAWI